jgi:hypothetical protein
MPETPASETVTPRFRYPKIATPTGAGLAIAGTIEADPVWIDERTPGVVSFVDDRGAIA